MKVKKYSAPTMPEAMKLIRSELGNEAIILNSRVIQTKGIFGFFKKRSIEVIAALDEKPVEQLQRKSGKRKEQDIPAAAIKVQGHDQTDEKEAKEAEKLRKEISELKELLSSAVERKEREEVQLPVLLENLRQLLLKQELSEQIVERIGAALLKWWQESGENKSEAEVLQWTKEYMLKKISHLSFSGISYTKKFITVVGPTGVGKTTTLAKMAADSILKHNKKVAFITTDTYRIAAIDQLKTYANILNVPIEVCYNSEDFQRAVTKFADFDTVFIDTAGRNFRNPVYVADLKKQIGFHEGFETFLVLSLTAKQRDMDEIFRQFTAVNIDKIILTKADETSTYGAMYNILYSWQKPIAYITNGQNVPDDILAATPARVVERLIGVNENE